MAKRLNILQIANKPPFPPMDGGAIGMNNVTHELLSDGHFVKIISVNTHKHYLDYKTLPKDYISKTDIEFVFIDTRIKPWDAFINLFGKKSYHIQRFFSDEMANLISYHLEQKSWDIVQLESIFLIDYLPIIRKKSNAKVVLRAPNVEYKIWERLAFLKVNPLKKWYLKILARRLKEKELSSLNLFDGIYTVTQNDLDIFRKEGSRVPMTFIPTGLDVTKRQSNQFTEKVALSIFHIGALDWMPNQEGLKWFLDEVWPQVTQEFPQVKFYIAGRRPTEWLKKLNQKNVEMLGEVEDAASFINAHSIMIAPLFSGSGMRVKIIEGMMLGKAVVSTTIGAEGIIIDPGKDILIADTSKEFISAILFLLGNEDELKAIQNQAKENCSSNYAEEKITRKLVDFLYKLLD